MTDPFKTPPRTQAFTADDVEVFEKLRDFDGYFKIDTYFVRHKKYEGGFTDVMSREIFERGHAVAVLLFDPVLDKIVLIEQFRIGAFAALSSPWLDARTHSPWLLECVAGIIEDGETLEDVATRECLEEANCHVLDLLPITHYLVSPGGTSESVFLYCARVDASNAGGVHGLAHEHEDIRVLSVDTQTAVDWIAEGRYTNATTLIAMQWFALNHPRVRDLWT